MGLRFHDRRLGGELWRNRPARQVKTGQEAHCSGDSRKQGEPPQTNSQKSTLWGLEP
jgi:hypothetical protein